MHRMVFKGDYRGFVVWQEAGKTGVFVRDPSREWTRCDQERFTSIKQAEQYIDFVIERYDLKRPAKTETGVRVRPVEPGDFWGTP
jgi:hypothetical protein